MAVRCSGKDKLVRNVSCVPRDKSHVSYNRPWIGVTSPKINVNFEWNLGQWNNFTGSSNLTPALNAYLQAWLKTSTHVIKIEKIIPPGVLYVIYLEIAHWPKPDLSEMLALPNVCHDGGTHWKYWRPGCCRLCLCGMVYQATSIIRSPHSMINRYFLSNKHEGADLSQN